MQFPTPRPGTYRYAVTYNGANSRGYTLVVQREAGGYTEVTRVPGVATEGVMRMQTQRHGVYLAEAGVRVASPPRENMCHYTPPQLLRPAAVVVGQQWKATFVCQRDSGPGSTTRYSTDSTVVAVSSHGIEVVQRRSTGGGSGTRPTVCNIRTVYDPASGLMQEEQETCNGTTITRRRVPD